MATVRGDVERALAGYGLPKELLAVPLVESGYKNLPPEVNRVRAAGMWQFMADTARRYRLVVDETVDQRMDVTLATDAALRLLSADRLRFQDWLLSLAAYNQGEEVVQGAINRAGTRDAWRLIEAGELNDYVTLVTAGAIVIAYPDLVR
jgi:membrane-bound lytic murein transglycosylase D